MPLRVWSVVVRKSKANAVFRRGALLWAVFALMQAESEATRFQHVCYV